MPTEPDLNAPWPPAPPADHAELAASEIIAFLVSQGIARDVITMSASNYSLPASDWCQDEFATAFTHLLGQLNFTFKDESRNCQAFSRFAVGYAQWLHSETPTAGLTMLAVADFHFISDTLGAHAIVCAVTQIDGKTLVQFFEPQATAAGLGTFSMRPMELSPWEIKSCLSVRF